MVSLTKLTLVSILIAARNEEACILSCLESIGQQHYPIRDLEVLIGNDQSEDRTAERIRAFIREKPHFRLVEIRAQTGHQQGKANVLLQLIRQSRGEYLLFTDADVRVPPTWIAAMRAACTPGVGLVGAITLPGGTRLFDRLQAFDWLLAHAQLALATELGMAVTAMGNNMLVTREAYLATGGYEHLPFSVVEDQTLFRAVVQKGYGFKNLHTAQVLATTRPAGRWTDLLRQRKRWMRGAMQIHWVLVCLLFGQALFIPLLITLGCFFPTLSMAIFTAKVAADGWMVYRLRRQLGRKDPLLYLIPYQFYHAVVQLALILYYFLPIHIEWKGRKYA